MCNKVVLCIIFAPIIKHEELRDLVMLKEKFIKMKKIIYQVDEIDLENLFNKIIEQREQAKNNQVHYTLKDVLKITGKNRSTLWNWERKGYLKPVRMGKTLLYLKSDIEAIMNQKRGCNE